jgi:hypothetical protein
MEAAPDRDRRLDDLDPLAEGAAELRVVIVDEKARR